VRRKRLLRIEFVSGYNNSILSASDQGVAFAYSMYESNVDMSITGGYSLNYAE